MLLTAEIRWFWREIPPAFEAWFRDASPAHCAAGGGAVRVDEYLAEAGKIELGVKRRGGTEGLEIKGMVTGDFATLSCAPFTGPIGLWCKWSSELLEMPSGRTITVEKRRWLRRFASAEGATREIPLDESEQPAESARFSLPGCNVELTRIGLPDNSCWWTLGFEALGTLPSLAWEITQAAKIMVERRPPPIEPGWIGGYPAWMNRHVLASASRG
ncbi:MAG TPA: hypothetical protein VFW45_13855 [Candidatus Polarisedimenticolia bacterium]|nr:hypothetical protein [Candidatus Polarisedimenticolia bacterium]